EGTYPLPEAELDRFMAKVLVGYPDSDAERGVLERTVQGFEADRPATYGVSQVTDAAGLERLRAAVEAVRVASQITAYIAGVVRFWGSWYFVGTRAGVLWTRRALWVGAVCALAGLAALWIPWGLDAMLVADLTLVAVVWLDAALAARPGRAGLGVSRDAAPA